MSDDQIQSERPDSRDIAKQPRPLGEGQRFGDEKSSLPKLGSLAQTARGKHLKQARNTLLTIGILIALLQAGFFFVEMGHVKDAFRKQVNLTPAQAQQAEMIALTFVALFHSLAIAVGIALVVLSFFVQRYPVPILITALVLYIGLQVVFTLVDRSNLLNIGIIVKIIFIVALVKALQAGLAAQREEREAQAAVEYGAQHFQ